MPAGMAEPGARGAGSPARQAPCPARDAPAPQEAALGAGISIAPSAAAAGAAPARSTCPVPAQSDPGLCGESCGDSEAWTAERERAGFGMCVLGIAGTSSARALVLFPLLEGVSAF